MRRRIRLSTEAYSVTGSTWLVTVATLHRERRPLAEPALATAMLDCFVNDCPARGTALHLAMILPDHAHLIVEVTAGNLVDLMRDLKTRTTRLWWEHGSVGALWQKSFHDRGLRTATAFDEAVKYVLDNPVRAGLAGQWEDYPFCTGLVIDGG